MKQLAKYIYHTYLQQCLYLTQQILSDIKHSFLARNEVRVVEEPARLIDGGYQYTHLPHIIRAKNDFLYKNRAENEV